MSGCSSEKGKQESSHVTLPAFLSLFAKTCEKRSKERAAESLVISEMSGCSSHKIKKCNRLMQASLQLLLLFLFYMGTVAKYQNCVKKCWYCCCTVLGSIV